MTISEDFEMLVTRIRSFLFAAVVLTLGTTATAQEKPQGDSRPEVRVLTPAVRAAMGEAWFLLNIMIANAWPNSRWRQEQSFDRLKEIVAAPRANTPAILLAIRNFDDNELAARELESMGSDAVTRAFLYFRGEKNRVLKDGDKPSAADQEEFDTWRQKADAVVGMFKESPEARQTRANIKARAYEVIKAVDKRGKK
jgi:hypothetical protein